MALNNAAKRAAVSALRRGIERVGLAAWLLGMAMAEVPSLVLRSDRFSRRRFVDALFDTLLQPLPVFTVLAATMGLVLALIASRVLDSVNFEAPLLLALRDALMREVMPLLVAIFVAGRSGVGLSVRIGRMTAAGEIDALRLMGINPLGYVLPSNLIAFVAASGVLFVWGVGIAHLTAAVSLQQIDAIPTARYIGTVLAPTAWKELSFGLLRVESFALLVFAVAAAEGCGVSRAPQSLDGIAREAFILSLLVIFGAAALFVWLGA